jgi:hypothetical protein
MLNTIQSLEEIEEQLKQTFQADVVNAGIQDSIRFLKRWSHLSTQVTRLHGAALARTRIPEIQALLAEIAHGECGSGDRQQIHSKLLNQIIQQSPIAAAVTEDLDLSAVQLFEEVVDRVCQMNQDQAIGFVVGLEAPAYDILKLLKQALIGIQIPERDVTASEYMVIHEAVEKEHQDSGHEAMEIVLQSGCDLGQIYEGGAYAIRFLTEMVGEKQMVAA